MTSAATAASVTSAANTPELRCEDDGGRDVGSCRSQPRQRWRFISERRARRGIGRRRRRLPRARSPRRPRRTSESEGALVGDVAKAFDPACASASVHRRRLDGGGCADRLGGGRREAEGVVALQGLGEGRLGGVLRVLLLRARGGRARRRPSSAPRPARPACGRPRSSPCAPARPWPWRRRSCAAFGSAAFFGGGELGGLLLRGERSRRRPSGCWSSTGSRSCDRRRGLRRRRRLRRRGRVRPVARSARRRARASRRRARCWALRAARTRRTQGSLASNWSPYVTCRQVCVKVESHVRASKRDTISACRAAGRFPPSSICAHADSPSRRAWRLCRCGARSGDPLRARYIAETFFEGAREVNAERGMLGYSGTFEGQRISVQSSRDGLPERLDRVRGARPAGRQAPRARRAPAAASSPTSLSAT